jgi:molybdopterin-containing oxidoreductase family iron-sulfur binding subunit
VNNVPGSGIRDQGSGPGSRPEPLRFWRSLEELADDPAFRERLHNEFPSELEAVSDPVERRTFLKVMGASLALAGIGACTTQPEEKIVPYVRQPEEMVPGTPLYYATAMTIGGVATGLIVESHEGRPTKIEGNPEHPGSLGATDAFAQAAILDLYDPDRAQAVTNLEEIRAWPSFLGAIRAALAGQEPLQGAGFRILTESIGSPTLAWQLRELLARFPAARHHQWDPASRENARAGARLAFGEYVDVQYRIDLADVILALDADFLACGGASVRYAREFAARRRPDQIDRMNRLYAVESMPTSTGARADHRLPLAPSRIEAVARRIASAVGVSGAAANAATLAGPNADAITRWADAAARDLQSHRGASLVIAGDTQPPVVHALVHAINAALGNAGRTVVYTDPVEALPTDQLQSLRDLAAEMNAGRVDMLVMLGGNPVYTAPADLNFADALGKVPLRVHLSLHANETSELCHWHIPETHFLESWSDARAFDGTASIVQPLIAPLYGGRSPHELLNAMGPTPEKTPYDTVREYWMEQVQGSGIRDQGSAGRGVQRSQVQGSQVQASDAQAGAAAAAAVSESSAAFEAAWRRWLHDGVIPNTAFAPKSVALEARSAGLQIGPGAGAQPADRDSTAPALELSFRHDPTILDGRFANNGWLQELPKPITKITWDNAVIMSPATAAGLGVGGSPAMAGGEHGRIDCDLVELGFRGRTVRGPVFIVPGHADGCVTIHFGYGRRRAGRVGNDAGFDANLLRTSDAPWFGGGLTVAATGERRPVACTQYHRLMEDRGLVRVATREQFARDPRAVHADHPEPPRALTLYPDYRYEGYRWGMAIDVNACIGCNACVVGCQAENNIPVVGRDQVLRGREMHWLRIDTYHRGPAANPETYFQPILCMQCENAPCEPVCPVGATVHSHEGLNDMVYNRCVGTRYCSNNCPYKVRRFNYLLFQDWSTPSLKLGRNPDVTVRSRGVMEKCTYCVQRINEAKIRSKREDRRVRDGEIETACQAACPADAIVFGDLNDPDSRVARLQAEPRNYPLLADLNTRPRTTYLAAVRNVNQEIEE